MRKFLLFWFIALIAFSSMGIPVALHGCRSDRFLTPSIGYETKSCCSKEESTNDLNNPQDISFQQNSCCIDSQTYCKCDFTPIQKNLSFTIYLPLVQNENRITEVSEFAPETTPLFDLTENPPPLLRRLAFVCTWLI